LSSALTGFDSQEDLIDFRQGRVGQWKSIFDFTYKPKNENAKPDFTGWRSSYTNKDIPATEMSEWVERTCERILSYKPRRILEIGCGVGLLLERLAPHCEAYTGTDVSATAVDRLRQFVESRHDLNHVTLMERDASNFDSLCGSNFDMVVINSVVQYFPELGYLEQVLSSAAQTVVEGGHIFVGDIRNLSLQRPFHTRMHLAKAHDSASIGWLRNKILLSGEHERELVIDPQFFLNFARSHPGFAGAQTLLKRGRAKNEMTSYRYDAVLHLGTKMSVAPQRTLAWQDSRQLADLMALHKGHAEGFIRIVGLPNARIEADRAAWLLVAEASDNTTISTIREKLNTLTPVGIDPESLFEEVAGEGYDVQIEARAYAADGSFDVVIPALEPFAPGTSGASFSDSARFDDPRPVSTNPLFAARKQEVADHLWTRLQERLPTNNLPSALYVVDQLPPHVED
ncbi:MAG: hypothetical protein RIR97_1292, partial [Pseudomonadota bacterium]